MTQSIQTQHYTLFDVSQLISDDLRASYEKLYPDEYHPDKSRFRRFAQFYLSFHDSEPKLELLSLRPFTQRLFNNRLVGNMLRYFPQIKVSIEPFILRGFAESNLPQSLDWQVNCHQIRVRGDSSQSGRSSPEGVHRDGVDFTMMACINRVNILGGESKLYDDNINEIFSKTLDEGEAVIIDDRVGYHFVSEFKPINSDSEGFRDMLIIAFQEKSEGRYGPNYEIGVTGTQADSAQIQKMLNIG